MARRRMFSLDVVDTDRFLDMPISAQALYYHMGMRADDDGFVASPKRIAAICGCGADDIKLLVAKGFVVPFDTGVIFIRDWRRNNQIRPDRYTPTQFQMEKQQLTDGIPDGNQMTYQRVPQVSLGKNSIDKDSIIEADKPPAPAPKRYKFTPPTVEQVTAYCKERNNGIDAERFISYYEARGWKLGNTPMKSWQAAVRTWEKNKKGNENIKAAEQDYSAPPGFDFV